MASLQRPTSLSRRPLTWRRSRESADVLPDGPSCTQRIPESRGTTGPGTLQPNHTGKWLVTTPPHPDHPARYEKPAPARSSYPRRGLPQQGCGDIPGPVEHFSDLRDEPGVALTATKQGAW